MRYLRAVTAFLLLLGITTAWPARAASCRKEAAVKSTLRESGITESEVLEMGPSQHTAIHSAGV